MNEKESKDLHMEDSLSDDPNAGKAAGRWTQEEHKLFLQGLDLYNKQWKQIADLVKTRTVVQIRTHAQKYFQKLEKGNWNTKQKQAETMKTVDDGKAATDLRANSISSSDGTDSATSIATSSEGESDAERLSLTKGLSMNSLNSIHGLKPSASSNIKPGNPRVPVPPKSSAPGSPRKRNRESKTMDSSKTAQRGQKKVINTKPVGISLGPNSSLMKPLTVGIPLATPLEPLTTSTTAAITAPTNDADQELDYNILSILSKIDWTIPHSRSSSPAATDHSFPSPMASNNNLVESASFHKPRNPFIKPQGPTAPFQMNSSTTTTQQMIKSFPNMDGAAGNACSEPRVAFSNVIDELKYMTDLARSSLGASSSSAESGTDSEYPSSAFEMYREQQPLERLPSLRVLLRTVGAHPESNTLPLSVPPNSHRTLINPTFSNYPLYDSSGCSDFSEAESCQGERRGSKRDNNNLLTNSDLFNFSGGAAGEEGLPDLDFGGFLGDEESREGSLRVRTQSGNMIPASSRVLGDPDDSADPAYVNLIVGDGSSSHIADPQWLKGKGGSELFVQLPPPAPMPRKRGRPRKNSISGERVTPSHVGQNRPRSESCSAIPRTSSRSGKSSLKLTLSRGSSFSYHSSGGLEEKDQKGESLFNDQIFVSSVPSPLKESSTQSLALVQDPLELHTFDGNLEDPIAGMDLCQDAGQESDWFNTGIQQESGADALDFGLQLYDNFETDMLVGFD